MEQNEVSPSLRTICRFCGLQTGGRGHASERECIEALAGEVTKTKRLLEARHAPPARPVLRQPRG